MQPIASSQAGTMPVTAQPSTEPTGFSDVYGRGAAGTFATASNADSSDSPVASALQILSYFEQPPSDTGKTVESLMAELAQAIEKRLDEIDLADPTAVSDFASDLSAIFDVGLEGIVHRHPIFGLMSGIADTAFAALTHGKADPFGGRQSIEIARSAFSDISATFLQFGPEDELGTVSEAELQKMNLIYEAIYQVAQDDGIPIQSLQTYALADDEATLEGDFIEVAASATETDSAADPFGADAVPFADPGDPAAADDLGLGDLLGGDPTADDLFGAGTDPFGVPSDPAATDDLGLGDLLGGDPTAEDAFGAGADPFGVPSDPAATDDLGLGDLLGGDPTAEDAFGAGTDPFGVPSDPAATDDLGLGDLLGGDPTAEDTFGAGTDPFGAPSDPAATDDLGLGDLLGGDPTAEDPFGAGADPFADMLPDGMDDADEGLSAESSTDNARSDQNQTNLEDRFINLYETLMEKQISFKERVEAFKTDNQNAGKG